MFLRKWLWGPTNLEYVIKFALVIILFTYSTQLGMNVKHYITVFLYIIKKILKKVRPLWQLCKLNPEPMATEPMAIT